MGNNIFQSPFNITSAAINAAITGATLAPQNMNAASIGWIGWSNRAVLRSPADGTQALRNFAETISVSQVVEANEVLAQRNGVSPQISRIYNTYTDASNYERGKIAWNSNLLEFGVEAAGTGLVRGVRLASGGTIIGLEDAYTSGASVAVRRDGTSGSTIFAVGSTGLTSTGLLHTRLMPSINQASGTYCVLDINPTETAVGAGPHYLIRGRIAAGSDVFNVSNDGSVLSNGSIAVGGAAYYSMQGRSRIYSPANGQILLRMNSTSDFTRLMFGTTDNTSPSLKRNASALQVRLSDDSAFADFGANSLVANSGVLFMGANGTLTAVTDGIFAPKDNAGTSGGVLEFLERADPPAAGANAGRLYVRDNGGGKTQLVVRFPTGAIQVIATEP